MTNSENAQAVAALNSESPFRHLHRIYRHAKAAWEIALYDPALGGEDLPEEINDPLSDAHSVALSDLMLSPALKQYDLVLKLEIFRDEELYNWWQSAEFASAIASDARRLMAQGCDAGKESRNG